MHSVIVDEALASDLRSAPGEAEVWDEDEHFLGAFVPAPGAPPGPEWADEEDAVRNRVTVIATLREKMQGLPGELKVRDRAGRLLGWFVPVAPTAEEHFVEELRAGYSTADVLTELKLQAP